MSCLDGQIGEENWHDFSGEIQGKVCYRARAKAFWIALLSGMVEPVGGILGITVTSAARSILPYGLAFAGGAMLLVITEGVIPEAHSRGHHHEVTFGVIFGFIVMMILEKIFS